MKKTIPVTTLYFVIRSWGYNLLVLLGVLLMTSSLNATENIPVENNVEMEEGENNSLEDEYYIGFFIGSGRAYNEHIDVEGFANWGHPGSSSDYDNTETVGGVLVGKKGDINGMPIRLELDSTFGKISASTNKLDPEGLDETAEAEVLWLVTARAGLEKEVGPATLFANGGVAWSQIRNSVTDIDFRSDGPPQVDPDDSFEDDSIQLGWVIGLGAELPLSKIAGKFSKNKEIWTLRVEGFHADFGEKTYTVNHSGGNSCGVGGSRRPCTYNIDNKVRIVRMVISRPFSL